MLHEFHISKDFRDRFLPGQQESLLSEAIIFKDISDARECLGIINTATNNPPTLHAEDIYAMGLIHEALHIISMQYSDDGGQLYRYLKDSLGEDRLEQTLAEYIQCFPPVEVYTGKISPERYRSTQGTTAKPLLWGMFILHLNNANPVFAPLQTLITDEKLKLRTAYTDLIQEMRTFLLQQQNSEQKNLLGILQEPAQLFPASLQNQLKYIREHWEKLPAELLVRLLRGIDYLEEVNSFAARAGALFTKEKMQPYSYDKFEEHAAFSDDSDWMPKVVLLAKSTLVWLHQLSKTYQRDIHRLDQIPDEELDCIATRGFTTLWLIGLWKRSNASRTIKQRCGNPDAAPSAYAIHDYEIAENIGGWNALHQLKDRCWQRKIRLTADMVPNHTGIDSQWMRDHPDWFLSLPHSPYPSYSFNSANLSADPRFEIYLEDHYYDRSDAAVVFKRVDLASGETRYIYHGNDGTHTPWNDTAQLNYLNAETREAVIQNILHVAKNFSIIRFDAAMTLAKKHIHRLWFPRPGSGGAIPSRAEHGMTTEEFDKWIPQEFWQEVVHRINKELPDTLLLAEAFWMMEGYFVRTLGMHRVYNSAFMNMLKDEDNAKYRQTIKNTLHFDPNILKRFVNFMNNPDEDTTLVQFGDGDKYFGVCTLMVTMPGLPMFGHGQIEGFSEKYGMEYQYAYLDESPREDIIRRHEEEIFPLMKSRYLFAGIENFFLFDFLSDGDVDENVFAYSNASKSEYVLVVYNNSPQSSQGYIRQGIAQRLGLRATKDDWCLLRESKTNLWYIRKSSEIHQQGLFVNLRGYECQVYLNIHEVQDDAHGTYRKYSEHLAGEGVIDLKQALHQPALDPIHEALVKLCSPAYLARFITYVSAPPPISQERDQPTNLGQLMKEYRVFLEYLQKHSNKQEFTEQALNIFAEDLKKLTNSPNPTQQLPETPEMDAEQQANKIAFIKLICNSLRGYAQWNIEDRLMKILNVERKTVAG